MERTKVQERARTLEWLVAQDIIPGLLPKYVLEAAKLLREQEAELTHLRDVLATKDHIVRASMKADGPYRKEIEATFVITDPRIYFAAMSFDPYQMTAPGFEERVARHLTRVAAKDWEDDLGQRAFIAIKKALAQGIETRRAETPSGSVHESPVPKGDAP